jgi:hypothetical protein
LRRKSLNVTEEIICEGQGACVCQFRVKYTALGTEYYCKIHERL